MSRLAPPPPPVLPSVPPMTPRRRRLRGLPAATLRSRFQGWMDARAPRTDTLKLTHRNVYILPTRAGLMFALTLVVLLLASINYQLNLGYALTFLLAGSAVVSMHWTHATLRGLTLHLKPPSAGFAGDAVMLEAVLTSPGAARYGIGLKPHGSPKEAPSWLDVPAGGETRTHLAFVPPRRGVHPAPAIGIHTQFPLGLFRAWAVWRPAAEVLAWPAPERPAAALPRTHVDGTDTPIGAPTEGGEAEGVRHYRRGDPLKLIVWKKAAQADATGGEWVSRDTLATAGRPLRLDWQDAAQGSGGGTEPRLSRLAGWVMAAHTAGVEYGLRLPGVELAPGQGDAHRRRCLEALALWR